MYAAVAGAQQHQRQGPAFFLDGGNQPVGRRRHGPAVFVLQLELARAAVAGQVQDVVRVGFQSRSDLVRVTDFQDADLGILAGPSRLDGVQDVLQLALQVEHDRAGLLLVGRTDGGQDLQGAGQGRACAGREPQRTAEHHGRRVGGQQAIVRQSQRLERQAQQFGALRLDADFDQGADRAAVEQVADGLARVAGETE